jgi:hypothetical protein
MVESTIRTADPSVAIKLVTSSRGILAAPQSEKGLNPSNRLMIW